MIKRIEMMFYHPVNCFVIIILCNQYYIISIIILIEFKYTILWSLK